MILRLTLAAALALGCALPAAANTLSAPPALDFLPPQLAPRDLCNAPRKSGPDDLAVDAQQAGLTDPVRIRFLRRDIDIYQARDAARFFAFVDALIARRAAIDPDFAEVEATLARIELHLRAGRLTDLAERGLVPALAERAGSLGNSQRVQLAQYYRAGIGVAPDAALAQRLVRDAAFDGNARALLELARMEIQGALIQGWDAPLDLTVTMAFGGMLGELTPGICDRAEEIAQEYLRGEVVAPNPDIAHAWRRFAADMGGADAAWRVVEYHLSAGPERKNNAELRKYLRRAVELGLTVTDKQRDRIATSGAVSAEALQQILGFNHDETGRRAEGSVVPFLELTVNVDGEQADVDGLYLEYLREIAQMPEAPGAVFTELAGEVEQRRGRWASEPEVLELLQEAVRRGDEEGMQRLAERLVRYRDDPAMLNRAENLLLRTVELHGLVSSMERLDTLYRCQAPDAPRPEAAHWAASYRASSDAPVTISATDLIALDPYKDPETIAQIQTQALRGRTTAVADWTQRTQSGPIPAEETLRVWADRLDRSDQALEAFAELQFELATSPAERAQAVELFRRVYLNNGVTTALDLAIALVEDNARDPKIAAEIVALLEQAGNRGEGAAIRLLSRLQAGTRTEPEVYRAFADIIEDRGDFLALIFAIPHLDSRARAEDYIDRAVSLMNCGTKDVEEIGDAYAKLQDPQLSYHWRRVGLAMDHGHVLSKLRLSDAQMGFFAVGAAPDLQAVADRARADGEAHAHRRLFLLAADPGLASFDAEAAAGHLGEGIAAGDLGWALRAYRQAGPDIRQLVAARQDMAQLYRRAAEAGDAEARFSLGMLLREGARGPEDLRRSAAWLQAAAEAGHDDAMIELAFALGFGLGVERNPGAALDWLNRAAETAHPRVAELGTLIRVANAY